MGTEKPQVENKHGSPMLTLPVLLFWAVLLVVFVVLLSKKNPVGENEGPKLSPEAEARLQKRLSLGAPSGCAMGEQYA